MYLGYLLHVSDMKGQDVPVSDSKAQDVPVSDSKAQDVPVSDSKAQDVPLSDIKTQDVPVSNMLSVNVSSWRSRRCHGLGNGVRKTLCLEQNGWTLLCVGRRERNECGYNVQEQHHVSNMMFQTLLRIQPDLQEGHFTLLNKYSLTSYMTNPVLTDSVYKW